jgi:hypothetical protein
MRHIVGDSSNLVPHNIHCAKYETDHVGHPHSQPKESVAASAFPERNNPLSVGHNLPWFPAFTVLVRTSTRFPIITTTDDSGRIPPIGTLCWTTGFFSMNAQKPSFVRQVKFFTRCFCQVVLSHHFADLDPDNLDRHIVRPWHLRRLFRSLQETQKQPKIHKRRSSNNNACRLRTSSHIGQSHRERFRVLENDKKKASTPFGSYRCWTYALIQVDFSPLS